VKEREEDRRLPSLITLKLVGSGQNMTQGSSRFEIQKTLHLRERGEQSIIRNLHGALITLYCVERRLVWVPVA